MVTTKKLLLWTQMRKEALKNLTDFQMKDKQKKAKKNILDKFAQMDGGEQIIQ